MQFGEFLKNFWASPKLAKKIKLETSLEWLIDWVGESETDWLIDWLSWWIQNWSIESQEKDERKSLWRKNLRETFIVSGAYSFIRQLQYEGRSEIIDTTPRRFGHWTK